MMKNTVSKTSNISIACCVDGNYAAHAGIMMFSVLKNTNKPQNINFHIIASDFRDVEKEKIKKMIDSFNSSVVYHKLDAGSFANLKITKHASQAVYYRMILPKLLTSLDKVIYLDVDLIVEDDIAKLWSFKLKEYYLLAVAKGNRHFNSGVMVMNLKKWREDKIINKLFHYHNQHRQKIKNWDQDILTAVLGHNFGAIPERWNARSYHFNYYYKGYNNYLHKIKENPAVVHFTGPIKPWHFYSFIPKKRRYLYYKNSSTWKEESLDCDLSILQHIKLNSFYFEHCLTPLKGFARHQHI